MSNVGSSITFSALTSQKNSNSGYTIVISIAILFLITLITLIFYLYFCSRSAASPPRPQTEEDVETGLDETTLKTWPKLTYAEAKHLDPRAAAIGCCLVCLVDFEEEEEEEEEEDDDDKVLRLLPECGHLFHAICLDSWLRRQPTCPVCRSSAVNMLTPLAEVVPLAIVPA